MAEIKWHSVVTLKEDGTCVDVSRENIVNGQIFLEGVELLISGKVQISEENYNQLNDKSNFERIWQTKLYGIWVDGYMFNNHKDIRKIYREV